MAGGNNCARRWTEWTVVTFFRVADCQDKRTGGGKLGTVGGGGGAGGGETGVVSGGGLLLGGRFVGGGEFVEGGGLESGGGEDRLDGGGGTPGGGLLACSQKISKNISGYMSSMGFSL